MNIAILALQGAFAEHAQVLQSLGCDTCEIRNADDWQQALPAIDGLVIPGGESTTMTRIMHDEGLWQPVHDAISAGLPTFGTCAGLIMLDSNHLATMHITARRNAYGRQLGSFHTTATFKGLEQPVPMTFIRAPYIEVAAPDVEVLARVDGNIVAAKQGQQLVTAFHPELDNDARIHRYFLQLACSK